ncbi:MAG TPA: O-antigen ligase family protein [Thermoleophilaceae bacterium]|nr:O-antigen ligase family protein [Thermoleophilaceae bacterium]
MPRSPASFAASAPPAAPPRPAEGTKRILSDGAGRARAAISEPRGRSLLASLALAAALIAVAFGAEGGSELSRTTAVEVSLLLAGGMLAAAAIAFGPERGRDGLGTLLVFALYAGLVALSVSWSVAPDLTWVESSKTFAYLAVFAGAIAAARLAPGGWDVALKGILIAAGVVTAYALLSRILPGELAPDEIYARIGKPFNYWNAVGVTAALGVPPALWLASRRSGHPPVNALAFPLLGIFFVALFLSYSRGALAAAVLGAVLWLAFVPLRLRSLTALAAAAVASTPVILWALAQDAFTQDGAALAVKEDAGATFGLLVAAMIAVLIAAGLAAGFAAARRPPSALVRRRAGIAAIAVAAAAALAGIGALAFTGGGVGQRVSDLTSRDAVTAGGPERLTQSGSSRGRYWREAADVFGENTLAGTGANTFGVSRSRHRENVLVARHAHGFVAQTGADLGLLGLFAILALAAAWLAAAARTVGAKRGGHRLPFDSERAGLVALALAALVFGLQSAIDWTWSVPGPTVMALVAGGFVAARGPLPSLGAAPPEKPRWKRPAGERIVLAAGVGLLALTCVWSAVQPERADDASNRALALLARGDVEEAAEQARRAEDINPLSPRPLFVQAAIEHRAGRLTAAGDTLERAVRRYPSQPEVWLRLATFQLRILDRPDQALHTLRGALYLDPRSRAAQSAFFEARHRLRQLRADAARS